MKKIVILLITFIGLTFFGAWYYSDKKVVLRKTEALIECLQKNDETSPGLLSENTFIKLLDKEVNIDFRHPDMPDLPVGIPRNRDQLGKHYQYFIRSVRSSTLSDVDSSIQLIDDHSAVIQTTMNAAIEHQQYQLQKKLTVIFIYQNKEEGWRLNKVTIQ